MTPAEARERLMLHCGQHPNFNDPRWEFGFLGSLRPFTGLRQENFDDIMACMRVLAPELQKPLVDRKVVSALWGLCAYGRLWGVVEEGMLRRNHLITAEDVKRLARWIDRSEWVTVRILGGATDTDAVFADTD